MNQNNLKYYQIAVMNMSIQGEGVYTEALQSYFQAAEVSAPPDPVLLMRRNKVFVYCGIAENAGKAFVLCGTSGCGKSSALLDSLQKDGFKYLADDFGIVGKDGRAYRELKQLSEILNNIRAVGDAEIRNSYPEPAQLEVRYEQLLREGLTGKNIGLLEVPLKADPREIVDAMLDESLNHED